MSPSENKMKEKPTPQEKKRLSYEKDHRTHTGESNRGMRKTWAERKARVNRKYRRKADAVLHKAISPERIDALKQGDDETTRELIKKGLTRAKNPHKWGVRNLREALERLAESRTESVARKANRRATVIQEFKKNVAAFEKNPEAFRDDEISWLAYQTRFSELKAFFKDNPSWISRLQLKIVEVRKQRRMATEKARIKAEEKWKWRSPALRSPGNLNSKEESEQ